jgi:hypothetical protein
LTLLAPTGERMAFYEAARQYDKEALRLIASVMLDATAGVTQIGGCERLA